MRPNTGRGREKRNVKEADKVEVEVAPGVTVASLRRSRALLIGPTQNSPSVVDCVYRET